MKLTNKKHLPEPLFKAISNDQYVKRGDISVTSLIGSPKINALRKVHYDEIEEDAIDNVWSLLGSSVHHIIERANGSIAIDKAETQVKTLEAILDSGALSSQEDIATIDAMLQDRNAKLEQMRVGGRYISEYPFEFDFNGFVVTGTADLYDKETKTLYDFKVTSAWKAKGDSDNWEWAAQLNCYAYMLRLKGYEVDSIRIIAILKDWNKREAKADANNTNGNGYPQKQCVEIAIPVYSQEGMHNYILRQVDKHRNAIALADGGQENQLPDCTEKERWQTPTTYAIKKIGGKRAIRVLPTLDEATQYLTNNGLSEASHEIETRIGTSNRCKDFCPVFQWCIQKDSLNMKQF
jgi:hypothetical protein